MRTFLGLMSLLVCVGGAVGQDVPVPEAPAAQIGFSTTPPDENAPAPPPLQEPLKSAPEKKPETPSPSTGLIVGKDTSMRAYWNNGAWLETADKAFKVHVGGRTQFDIAGVTSDAQVRTGVGGIGPFDDAVNFRRARLAVDGHFWEVFEFNCEYDFLNTVNSDPAVGATRTNVINTPVPTDLWITISHIPWIGHLRIGNQKPPLSFEHITSSRYLTFLERSLQFDAFIEEGDNGFRPGLQVYNWLENERMTWQLGVFKVNRSIFGWNVGDGEYDVTGRITLLPWYRDEGRFMCHLGIGASHRDLDDDVVRFRARNLIRNGPAVLHNIIAISRMEGSSQQILNPEFFMNFGPFSVQAEYAASWVHDVGLFTTPTVTTAAQHGGTGTYFAQGAYLELGCFLTGEHRSYSKKGGSGAATTRQQVFRPYFFVRGEDGQRLFSSGAWQVIFRYSWLDLDNTNIYGGTINDFTAGLNWYLNPNFKIQWNYDLAYRHLPGGTSSGTLQGAGVRFAFDF